MRAAVKKAAAATPFEDAFVANMKNGMGVYESNQKACTDRTAYGSFSCANGRKPGSYRRTARRVQELVNERIVHEMNRILNGYGG